MKREVGGKLIAVALITFAVWLFVAETVFAFRHPWATGTQRFMHTFDALMFRRVAPPWKTR